MSDAPTHVEELRLVPAGEVVHDPTQPWTSDWLAPEQTGQLVELWRTHLQMHRVYRDRALEAFFGVMLGRGPRVGSLLLGLWFQGALRGDQDVDGDSPHCGEFRFELVPARTTWRWPEREVGKRPRIVETLRRAVLVRDRGTCRYCGQPALLGQLDHVVPHSTGGSTSIDNLVLACIDCNGAKNTYCWIPRDAP